MVSWKRLRSNLSNTENQTGRVRVFVVATRNKGVVIECRITDSFKEKELTAMRPTARSTACCTIWIYLETANTSIPLSTL